MQSEIGRINANVKATDKKYELRKETMEKEFQLRGDSLTALKAEVEKQN